VQGRRPKEKSKQQPYLVKAKLSVVEFPEMCPVCLAEPEDLISVTVMEQSHFDRSENDSIVGWSSGKDVAERVLAAAQGAATFWVPTCMRHGTKSLRSGRMRFLAWAAFFALFYPGLYFALGLLNAVYNPRPWLQPLAGLVVTVALLLSFALYGYYPRATERMLGFVKIARSRDTVILRIGNREYAKMFLELNAVHAERIEKMDDTSTKAGNSSS